MTQPLVLKLVQENLTTFQSKALLKETMKEKKLIKKGSKIKQVILPLCFVCYYFRTVKHFINFKQNWLILHECVRKSTRFYADFCLKAWNSTWDPQSSPALFKGCGKLFYSTILLQNNVLGIFQNAGVCEITKTDFYFFIYFFNKSALDSGHLIHYVLSPALGVNVVFAPACH